MTVVEIQEMRLRISGFSPQEAQEISRQVTRSLAARVESLSAGGDLSRLDLKIRAPEGQTADQLAEAIVQAIVDQIGRPFLDKIGRPLRSD